MSDDIHIPPPQHYQATQASLGLAQHIADVLGYSFDEAKEALLATKLYNVIYDDIIELLGLKTHKPELHSGSYNISKIFAAQTSDNNSVIVLDMVFDFWIYAVCFLVSIKACHKLNAEQAHLLTQNIHQMMMLLQNPEQFNSKRHIIRHYHISHAQVLGQLSHPIARSMTTFILCHEIAHHRLGHVGMPSTKQQELDADQQAALYFNMIVEKGKQDNQSYAHVDEKISFSPLLLFRLFDLHEHWLRLRGHDFPSETHPPALERLQHVENAIHDNMNDKSRELYSGLCATVDDIKSSFSELLSP